MKTTTRRGVIATMAAAATVAVTPASATDDALRAGVQALIAELRALPGSTPWGVYLALQAVGDRLERVTGGVS